MKRKQFHVHLEMKSVRSIEQTLFPTRMTGVLCSASETRHGSPMLFGDKVRLEGKKVVLVQYKINTASAQNL
jgi:hypothetical protein